MRKAQENQGIAHKRAVSVVVIGPLAQRYCLQAPVLIPGQNSAQTLFVHAFEVLKIPVDLCGARDTLKKVFAVI